MAPGDRRVGVDVGGTFTDVVVAEDAGIQVGKAPTTPAAPHRGVSQAIASVLAPAAGSDGDDHSSNLEPSADLLRDVSFFGHGTTHTTNAVLEGEWADVALVTTAGFRDVLEIGRQDRPDLYDLDATKPSPIVPRDRRFEVPERLDETGDVRKDLDTDAVRAVGRDIAGMDLDAVAVCLLFAFANDAHEQRTVDELRAAGVEVPIVRSSAVAGEIREYERTLTTALNAALVPVVDAYLDRLEAWTTESGLDDGLHVVGSNGGLRTAMAARERPVGTLLSGPAAGVQGAVTVANANDATDPITMDMGGTSCDVSLVDGGEPPMRSETSVGDYTVRVPSVDVHTVGAGGGSIAWIDDGGALRVGPRSAGADPGPVCYGRGGEQPTVTDAQVILGRIDPDRLGVGGPRTDGTAEPGDAVREAFAGGVADALDRSVHEAARGVLDVANAAIAQAIRVVTVERGHDPRERPLVAFGGAGPLHATAVAADLGVERVLLPARAGVLSALGIVASDAVHDERVSHVESWANVDPETLGETLADLAEGGRSRIEGAGSGPIVEPRVDLRYEGQTHELTVPLGRDDTGSGDPTAVSAATLDATADRFHARHRDRYGHAAPDEPIELVTIRVRVRAPIERPTLGWREGGSLADAQRGDRTVTFDRQRTAAVYRWNELPTGSTVTGPAVIEGAEHTALLRPTDDATVTDTGALDVEVGDA